MNKSELIEAIAQEAGISKSAAQKALDATTNAVTNALKTATLLLWSVSVLSTSANVPNVKAATLKLASL